MFKHIVRVNMPKQGKKSNGLEKKNAVVKCRIGEMLQHSTCFKKKKKKNPVQLQPAGLRSINYLYGFCIK